MPRPLTGPTTFIPRVWDGFFDSLSAEDRRQAAVSVCRAVLSEAPAGSPLLAQAVEALADDATSASLLRDVDALLDRLEAEYDELIGEDESKLALTDRQVEDAFLRARAASVVKFALEDKLSDMVYEAWQVLGDLDRARELVGMEQPAEPVRTGLPSIWRDRLLLYLLCLAAIGLVLWLSVR